MTAFPFSRSLFALAPLCLLAAPAPAAAAPGLVADYTDGQRRLAVVVPTPHFSLNPGESIHPQVAPRFAASWTGTLKITEPGKYRFDPGSATLLVDGKKVEGAPVDLAAGNHKLRIEYRRTQPRARLQVLWSSQSFGPEPLPADVLEHDKVPAAVAGWATVERGRALVEELNCRGCHAPDAQQPHERGRGPILSKVGARTSAGWIYQWLADPTVYRPNARMPHVPLSEPERRDVAAYLATAIQRGYADAGSIEEAEAKAKAEELAKKGEELADKVGCKSCHGEGPGLVSLKAVGSKMNVAALRAYLLQPQRVEPTGRMPSMLLSPPEAAALATFLSGRRDAAFEAQLPAGGSPSRGKELVTTRGCLGCHSLEEGTEPVQNRMAAPVFRELASIGRGHEASGPANRPVRAPAAGRGCLSTKPAGLAPRYRLTDADRGAIALYLRNPDIARAPTVEARRALTFHRCNACHEIEGPALATLKETPPSLRDTGNKLRVSWLREVLGRERARLRPWIELRMPEFANAAALADGFAALAGASRDDPPPPPKPDALTMREGVRYLGRGEEGLACITCHSFAWYNPGAATPAPDLSTMGRRMRPEWFDRWLRDPGRIQPGTQMPAFFVDVEKGVVDQKVQALWAALSTGRNMPVPEGVTPDDRAVKLVVGKEPQIFRSFVVGGSTRSILVGFPGGQSYAFEADTCRLAFAWSGEFLDVRQVWVGRGGQEAKPLGEVYFTAAAGSPLRVNDAAAVPTPRFEGYVLEKGAPVFLYEVAGSKVRQKLSPAPKGAGLVVSIEVRGKDLKDVYYVVGNAPGVELAAQGASWDGARVHAPAKGGVARFAFTFTPKTRPAQAQR